MRDHGATSLENMLYVNGLGFWIVLVFARWWTASGDRLHAAHGERLTLLIARSLTFYLGAFAYDELTTHSGSAPDTSEAKARKELTVMLSFVAFPDDKPFSGWFLAGILTFIAAIGLELKSRIEKKRR